LVADNIFSPDRDYECSYYVSSIPADGGDELRTSQFDGTWGRLDHFVRASKTGADQYSGTNDVITYINGVQRDIDVRGRQWDYAFGEDQGFHYMTTMAYYSPWRGDIECNVDTPDGAAVNGCATEADWHYQDMYIATGDNARARVEICEGSTWATRGGCELQPIQAPSGDSWATGRIVFTLQQGEFASLSGKYVYVVVDDGSDEEVALATGFGIDQGTPPPPANNPPTTSWVSPSGNPTVTANTSQTLTASASDSDGTVASYRFLANGSLACTASFSTNWSCNWTPTVSGTYTVIGEATDNPDGDIGITADKTFTVNPPVSNNAPSVTISVNTSGPSPACIVTDECSTGAAPLIDVSATDAEGGTFTSTGACYVDGNVVNIINATVPDPSPFTGTFQAWTPNTAGTYAMYCTVPDPDDGFALIGTSNTLNLVIVEAGNTAPTVTINRPNTDRVDTDYDTLISATATDAETSVSLCEAYSGDPEQLLGPMTNPSGNTWETTANFPAQEQLPITVRCTDTAGVFGEDSVSVESGLPACFISSQGYGGYWVADEEDSLFDGIGDFPESPDYGFGHWTEFTLPAQAPSASDDQNAAVGIFGQTDTIGGYEVDGCQLDFTTVPPTCTSPGTDAFPAGMDVLAISPAWKVDPNGDEDQSDNEVRYGVMVDFTLGSGRVTNFGTVDFFHGLKTWGGGSYTDPRVSKIFLNTLEEGLTEWATYDDNITLDTDGDGFTDDNDNCVTDFNAGQTDTDLDGEGDACDPG
jgi:hypothetical protein